MKAALAIFGIVGWLLFARLEILQHQRTAEVKMWAESVYEAGGFDALNHAPVDVMQHNRDFIVGAVVKAHQGAWDKF